MLYIDFDGVIVDTDELLFKKWRENPERYKLPESEKIKYIQSSDWEYILNNSLVINDAVSLLNQIDPNDSAILTKIYSIENEGCAKIRWIRENGIKQNVILVPYDLKKTDIVDAKGNTLIDDTLSNLDDWEKAGGKVLFFDINDDGYDSWDKPNTKGYQKVLTLSMKACYNQARGD